MQDIAFSRKLAVIPRCCEGSVFCNFSTSSYEYPKFLLLDLPNGFQTPLEFFFLANGPSEARNTGCSFVDSKDINAC